MATPESHSSSPQAGGTFAGDPFCTRGLRDALDRLERQIGRFSDVTTEPDVPPASTQPQSNTRPNEGHHSFTVSPPIEAPSATNEVDRNFGAAETDSDARRMADQRISELESRLSEVESRCASLAAELGDAIDQRTAGEQRCELLRGEAEAAMARATELEQQVLALQEALRQQEAAALTRAAELERQVSTLQEALRQHEAAPQEPDPAIHKRMAALQAELQLLRKERDQLMSRLHREESRLQEAGISIKWAESPAKAKPVRGKRRSSG